MMKQRSLGQSKVPAVGLGCMGMSEFYGPVDERANLALLDRAAAKGVTVAQLALAWVLHQGEHLHIIPGTRTEQYLRDNFRNMEVSFSALELAELRECFAPSRIAGERYPEFLMADMEG